MYSSDPPQKAISMIRIVKEENTQVLNQQSKAALSLIGVAVAKNPKPYKMLLDRYGIQVPTSDKISLANGLVEGLALQNKTFNRELTELLSNMVESETAYNPDEDEYHYVQAIAGAIAGISGAVGSIVGGKNKQKMAKEEARREMLNNMLAMKAQEQQAAAEERKLAGKKSLYLIIGVLGLLGIISFFYFRQRKNLINTNPS